MLEILIIAVLTLFCGYISYYKMNVRWVPTPQALIEATLDMAAVTSADNVIDLGSGDGRIVIAAAKRGASALGLELNPSLLERARRTAAKEGVSDRATFEQADIFESDLSNATVVILFLNNRMNLKLRPKLLGLKPGTRIVSIHFTMGDWKPDKVVRLGFLLRAYLWTVPTR